MKLILCPKCSDVRSLRENKLTICECGESSGKYINDLHAIIYGKAIPLGFSNPSFVKAIKNQPEVGPGYQFTAFVIEKNCPTIKIE